MPKLQDQRKFFRHPIECPIQVRETTDPHLARCQSENISAGGLCFFCDHKVPPQSAIEVDIPVQDKLFHLHGRVVYSQEDKKTHRFKVGISFEDADSLFKVKLAEEILAIEKLRKSLERVEGHKVSEEEAARQCIHRHAKAFGDFFKET